ncbi:hypothetical protein ACN28E_48735 [Archangium lansingense]|uniref:hypothetical protein n=1 Tax=Archangium lansingense TaxID=2995310 RepID=UPI003B7D46A3
MPCILIAVVLALGDLIRRAAHPHDAVLGEREGVPGYHDIERHEGAETVPGLFIYRFDAPLFFANVRHLAEAGAPASASPSPPAVHESFSGGSVMECPRPYPLSRRERGYSLESGHRAGDRHVEGLPCQRGPSGDGRVHGRSDCFVRHRAQRDP